ncbi:HU family DNA-binding protein [uncultured Phocaeicola sp.]|uniref:HU family DNA-binding protein n=1 Tax=uncultured Phocaeicola sp. TaxID=990718 RepID=UPI0026004BE5|nr:HU family DNA-binding protein [uncultured Phocaeicola sp.]
MSIYYRVVERKDPRDLESSGKYYASGASVGSMGLNELASRVAIRSGHSQGTVAGILYDLCEAIVYFIGQGRNVDLGNFGIIQLRLRNKIGSDTKEGYRISQIGEKKLYFVPGPTITNKVHAATLTNADALYENLTATSETTAQP